MPKTITATCTLIGHELTKVPVVNPGDWFGKTWLLEIGGSYTPLFLIVEADSASDAIDELADSEKWGHNIVVDDADLGDYDPETCHYGPSGQVLDLDHLAIHGCEGCDVPFPCRYHGDGLPTEGVDPAEFCWDDFDEDE
ncbi:hypothetical protein DTL42_14185 [Bremerella cremea]|uniref:Uncharacterized protein n=1 Tax=Bremerella cremea TaxID=1031537 RepID=A0A368KSG7_9BACT|nr:hypothetical protein [Bremerella cremea]RCS47664.1 hypothetical protein DTL42_14185 [Bremerella cremea]